MLRHHDAIRINDQRREAASDAVKRIINTPLNLI